MQKNLNDLSESELKDVIGNAEKALQKKRQDKRKEVVAQIKELAASIDVAVEITDQSKKSTRKGLKVPAKYQDPNNRSQKWSGRGMKPKWLQALLKKGHSLEEFKIKA